MPTYDVQVETLDRRCSFGCEWEADSKSDLLRKLNSDGGIDVLNDDDALEFYPLAGIRKITISEVE